MTINKTSGDPLSFQNDIEINGIIEQINTQGSEYEYLLDLSLIHI